MSQTLMCSLSEAVVRTSLSRSTLYRLMDSGELAFCKIGSRRLIPEDSLVGLVQASRNDAA